MHHKAQVFNIEERIPTVKADIENGYDRLAHDLTNALASNNAKLSGCEFQLVFALISKTYRWHKKSDWVSYEQLSEITNMSIKHIGKEVRSLISKKVFLKDGRKIGLNAVVTEWESNQSVAKKQPISSNRKATNQLPKSYQSVPKGNQLVAKKLLIRPPQKKETITKETNTKEKSNPRELLNFELPSFIPEKIITEFIQHRKQIKKPMSELALSKFVAKLTREHEQGYCLERIVDNAIANGWQTTYPKKEDKLTTASQYSDKTADNMRMLNEMEFDL